MQTESKSDTPLIFVDVKDAPKPAEKNSAPYEAKAVVDFVKQHIKDNPGKSVGVVTPFANQQKTIKDALKNEGITNVTCGTVHAFQGDEKDTILFSTALTDNTHPKTYDWLKNNKELINVATSRAFGVKPYSTETEKIFLTTLSHAIENLPLSNNYVVRREVAISQVFSENKTYIDLFYTGRFDFVVYDKPSDMPLLAVELDGKEHVEESRVIARDRKKGEICRSHGFELIRVDNSYARRYNYIKDVLIEYFSSKH